MQLQFCVNNNQIIVTWQEGITTTPKQHMAAISLEKLNPIGLFD